MINFIDGPLVQRSTTLALGARVPGFKSQTGPLTFWLFTIRELNKMVLLKLVFFVYKQMGILWEPPLQRHECNLEIRT